MMIKHNVLFSQNYFIKKKQHFASPPHNNAEVNLQFASTQFRERAAYLRENKNCEFYYCIFKDKH